VEYDATQLGNRRENFEGMCCLTSKGLRALQYAGIKNSRLAFDKTATGWTSVYTLK